MNLYRRFREGLVMNYYNELTKDKNEVLFDPSYEMSGIRGAVKIMVFSMIASVVLLPSGTSTFFVWLFLCSYIYKGAVESKMGSGYPYLEGYLGLLIGYLIAASIAIVIHFVFFGAYVYLVSLFDLSHITGLAVRLLILLIIWISYMFLFRDNTWDGNNKEWIKKFAVQDLEIKEEEEESRKKNGTYEDFIKKLGKKFTLPKDIKGIEQIKDPVVSKKKLDNFIKWAYGSSKNNKRPDLISFLNKSKKLEVVVPELSISISRIDKENGTMNIDLLDAYLFTYRTYSIPETLYREFDNRKWVAIINNPNITDETCDEIYGENYEDRRDYNLDFNDTHLKVYLKDENLYIPYSSYNEVYDDDEGYSDDYGSCTNLYCIQNACFWEKNIIINGSKFKFKEDEKEHLITLLMASYKPSLLKRILKGLEK